MTRLEKVKAILAEYQDINTVPVLVRTLGLSRFLLRIYSRVLVDNGLLKKIDLEPYQKARKRIAYHATGLQLTDELFHKVDEEVSGLYYKKRHIPDDIVAERKAKKAEIAANKKQQTAKPAKKAEEKSESENNGIYKLLSNPSKYFEDKYKNQQKEIRKEYKSPKAYAGVSAGMVW